MYLQLDTKFNPFTYDEMVKPLLYYKQAYDEAEAAYSDLVTQTEAWKDIANRENSPEAFEMYQRYSGDLSRAVDDFSKGMNSRNSRALLGLKRRYAQNIAPIARADEAMKAANDLRAKAGPDAIFEVGEYNSLDQFLHGKTANNKYQSREAIIKQTAAMTEAAMAEAVKDPEFKKYMGNQYWGIIQHTGGSYKDLTEAMKLGMMDNPIAQNRFSQIRQQMAKNFNIQDYDNAGQRAIMGAIDLGLYAGLDKPVTQFQANQGYIGPSRGGGGYSRSGGSSRRSSGSGSHGNADDTSAFEDEGSTYVANDVIFEIDGNKAAVPNDMKPSDIHGYVKKYEDLGRIGRNVKKIVDDHIGNSDPRQYEFYAWKSSATGKLRVQIKRKQSYTKPGPPNPSSRNEPSGAYLNDPQG